LLAIDIERLLLPSSDEDRMPDSGGETESERQTRYLAGRNSEVDSDIMFILRSSEIIPPTPGLRLPAVAYQPEKSDPAVHELKPEPLEPTAYEPEPLPSVAYEPVPEKLEAVAYEPEKLEPVVYDPSMGY